MPEATMGSSKEQKGVVARLLSSQIEPGSGYDKEAEKLITQAKFTLVVEYPFYSVAALRMIPVQTRMIPTLGVNSKFLFYNPDFVKWDGLDRKNRAFIMAHEILHVLLGHTTRLGERNPDVWNIATDLYINSFLISESSQGAFTMPKMRYEVELEDGTKKIVEEPFGLLDEKLTHEFGSSEAIYRELLNNNPELAKAIEQCESGVYKVQLPGGGEADEGCGGILPETDDDGEELSSEGEKQREQEIKGQLAAAVNVAKQAGKLSACMERMANEILQPKVNWRNQLHHFLDVVAKNDYSWGTRSRRSFGQPFYQPGLRSNEMGVLAVLIDTSGSIGDEQIKVFLSELTGIIADAAPSETHVVYVDHEVCHVETFEPSDLPLSGKAYGGGGTSFVPGFVWLENEDIIPRACIYFTDGYCSDFPPVPDFPVLWAVYQGEDNEIRRYTREWDGEIINVPQDFE